MKNFKDLFVDSGILTEDGQQFIGPVVEELKKLFISEEVKNMSASQLRVLGSSLSKLIGDMVCDKVQGTPVESFLNEMSDGLFKAYLQEKYGKDYMLKSLTKEEFNRCCAFSTDDLKEAIKQGAKDRDDCEVNFRLL